MFQKVFEYAGPHKKGLYAATAIVLVSVLMGAESFSQSRLRHAAPSADGTSKTV